MSSQHFTLQKQKNESGTIIKPDVSRISNVDPSMGLESRAVDPHGEMDKKAVGGQTRIPSWPIMGYVIRDGPVHKIEPRRCSGPAGDHHKEDSVTYAPRKILEI